MTQLFRVPTSFIMVWLSLLVALLFSSSHRLATAQEYYSSSTAQPATVPAFNGSFSSSDAFTATSGPQLKLHSKLTVLSAVFFPCTAA